MAGWTPGPWRYDPATGTVSGPDGTRVALIVAQPDPQTVAANGRLVAEAPVLFDVLEETQELSAFLLTERSWSRRIEECVRNTLERINAATARVMAWAPP